MMTTSPTKKQTAHRAIWMLAIVATLGCFLAPARSAWADGRDRTLIWEPTPPEALKGALPQWLEVVWRAVDEKRGETVERSRRPEPRVTAESARREREPAHLRGRRGF